MLPPNGTPRPVVTIGGAQVAISETAALSAPNAELPPVTIALEPVTSNSRARRAAPERWGSLALLLVALAAGLAVAAFVVWRLRGGTNDNR